MDLKCFFALMETNMKENGSMGKNMVKEHTLGLRDQCMWGNIRMGKDMGKELGQYSQRELGIKENLGMINIMVWDYIIMVNVLDTLENGKMGKDMGKGHSLGRMEEKRYESSEMIDRGTLQNTTNTETSMGNMLMENGKKLTP